MTAHPELSWLVATCVLTACLWMPYIIDRIREHGLWPALRNPNRDNRPKAAWADRLMWAHTNAIENVAVFAPLAIMVHILGVSSTATQLAAAVYFFTRLAHVLIYTAGVPLLRTITFVIGFGAQMTLAIALL